MTDAAQMDLLDMPELERLTVESERAAGVHTGDQLRDRDPGKYSLIVNLLRANVLTRRQIAAACRTSQSLIASVAGAMGLVGSEEAKKRRAEGWRMVEGLAQAVAVEQLRAALTNPELARKRSMSEVAILGGTAHDKAAMDEGEATARIEVKGESLHGEYLDYLEQARVIEAEIVGETEAGT